MKKIIFSSFVIAMLATSCGAPQRILYREAEGRNIEPAQNAVITPMVAELQVLTEQSISETIQFDIFVTSAIIGEIENYKRIALLNVAKKYNADTMVGALISVDTNKRGYLEITITGYPARYTNFRSMTQDDLWISKFHDEHKNATKKGQSEKPSLLNLFNKNK